MDITEQAFIIIIRENERSIKHLCRAYTARIDERKDLYQDIIIQLWKSLPDFKGDAKLSTWIYRIAVNTAISFYRKKSTRRNYHSAYKKEQQSLKYEEQDVGEQSEDERQLQELYNAIATLNASEKALISMYLEEFSYSEIAYTMDITENYVGVKLNRIKKKLSKIMGD